MGTWLTARLIQTARILSLLLVQREYQQFPVRDRHDPEDSELIQIINYLQRGEI
jgi:hypothetical protein